jgi:predicted DsbA family dithiol-disulfide isomerase
MRVEIWSDIVCPWCYIGKRRFEQALRMVENRGDIEVVHRAFQLNPSMPKGEVRAHRDHLMAKYGLSENRAAAMQRQMERTAAAEGLEFHLAGGVTGNTFDAHRVVHLGRVRGIQDAVIERLFRAHFTEQRSIFDADSLVTLAGEAGLDAADARAALAGDAYSEEVDADLRDARGFGISSVPSYVLDRRFAISGAQPPELFAEALTRLHADARTAGDRR